MRSAWRGPCANGITPSRMKSCRPMEVAMNSIAQQARPKLKTHREYRRPQFRTNRIGSPSTPGSSAMRVTLALWRGFTRTRSGNGSTLRRVTTHALAGPHRSSRPWRGRLRRRPSRGEVKPVPAGAAAGHPATAEVGVATLRAGGTAADAAVAATLASCVAESILTGIGGGGVATYYDAASRQGTCLDLFCAIPGL